MHEIVLRRSLCRLLVVFLIATFALCLFPSMVRAVTLLQLTDSSQPDYIPQLDSDSLVFSNFDVFVFSTGDATPPDLSNISVELFGAGTLKQGLRFVLNGELSVLTPSQFSMRVIRISYEVRHLGGDFIKGNSLVLDPLTAIAGNNAQVTVREDLSNGQNDPIKTVIYTVEQNVARQSWDGTVETPQAVLLPAVSVSSTTQASGQASVDSFEQIFSLVPLIDAGITQVVFDQVALEPTGDPMYDSFLWELYRKDGDELELVGSQAGKQTTFSNLENGIYTAKLTATSPQTVPAVDFVDIFAAGPCEVQPEPPLQADADLKVWGLKLKKYKRCKWSFARMYGTFDFPEVDLDHNGTVNAEVSIKLLGAKSDGGDFLVKGKTACKVRDHRYKIVIKK